MGRFLERFSLEKIKYVFTHPQESPKETVLLAAIFIIIPLIILTIVLLFLLPKEKAKKGKRRKKKISPKLKIGLFVLAMIVLFLANLFPVFYVSTSSFCSLCHKLESKKLASTSHKGFACSACHQRPGVLSWAEFKVYALGMVERRLEKTYFKRDTFPARAKVVDGSCLKCHKDVLRETVNVYGIRMSHKETYKGGFRCVDCHSAVAHGEEAYTPTSPAMDKCLSCHNDTVASAHCDLCHIRDVGKKASTKIENYPKVQLPPVTSCRGCHNLEKEGCTPCHGVEMPHPPDWTEPGKVTHARAAAFERKNACFKCHKSIEYCNSCHRFPGHASNWKQIHGNGGTASEPSCMSCHTKELSPVFCKLCH